MKNIKPFSGALGSLGWICPVKVTCLRFFSSQKVILKILIDSSSQPVGNAHPRNMRISKLSCWWHQIMVNDVPVLLVRIWPVSVSHLPGFGQLESHLLGFGQLESHLLGFGQLESHLLGFGQLESHLLGFGHSRWVIIRELTIFSKSSSGIRPISASHLPELLIWGEEYGGWFLNWLKNTGNSLWLNKAIPVTLSRCKNGLCSSHEIVSLKMYIKTCRASGLL
jgi:hypothetical protein